MSKSWSERIAEAKKSGSFTDTDHSVQGPEYELNVPLDGDMFSIAFQMGFAWQGAFKSNSIDGCEYIYSQMVKITKEPDSAKQELIVTETWDKINQAIILK